MRYHKLDLNLLTALKALLTEKNVTRAGEAVHITQPAMSGVLARLREYFGDPLIVQVGRKMELTPLAESLVEPLTDALLRIDATITTRPEFNPLTTNRRFSVVASDYSINVLLLEVLRRVHREAPGLSVEFRTPSESAPAVGSSRRLSCTTARKVRSVRAPDPRRAGTTADRGRRAGPGSGRGARIRPGEMPDAARPGRWPGSAGRRCGRSRPAPPARLGRAGFARATGRGALAPAVPAPR